MTAAMAGTQFYLACLDLRGRSVLVVGGGRVALEKVEGLLACGASVTVVSPQIVAELERDEVELVRRSYRTEDLDGRFLVVAATSTPSVNRRVYRDAEGRALLCNVVDVPELCSFILPAVHRQGPIAVAVSTGGASPALAQRLRDDIAKVVGPEHERLAHELKALRPWARSHLPTYEARRDYFAALVADALR